MHKKVKIAILVLLFLIIAIWIAFFFSTHDIAVLNPKGVIASKQRDLIAVATWLMLIVVIPVFLLTAIFAWRYRAGNQRAKYTPDWDHSHAAEAFWWGVPIVIIAVLAVITWRSTYELDPYKPIETDQKALVIQVVALDWKWLFLYPEQGIATVNFIQFPEQIPIHFEITADAPMNSFWIPQLGGQIYAMPAMKTQLYLMANEAGTFRGASANISGTGFAGMHFLAQSSSLEDFDRWVEGVRQSPNHLGMDEYAQLAKPSEDNPVSYYVLEQNDLFDRIIMKYMPKQPEKLEFGHMHTPRGNYTIYDQ